MKKDNKKEVNSWNIGLKKLKMRTFFFNGPAMYSHKTKEAFCVTVSNLLHLHNFVQVGKLDQPESNQCAVVSFSFFLCFEKLMC